MPAFAMGEGMQDSREGICRVVVLEDLDDDGKMDRRTVFADKLVLPRAIKTLADGRARGRAAAPLVDARHERRPEDGREGRWSATPTAAWREPGAQREQPHLGARQLALHVRARLAPAVQERRLRGRADAQPRAVGRLDRRRRARLSQRQQLAAVRGLHARPLLHAQPERRADARPLRVADLPPGRRGLAGAAHRAASIAATATSRSGPTAPRASCRARPRPSSTAAIACPRSCGAACSSPTARRTCCTGS